MTFEFTLREDYKSREQFNYTEYVLTDIYLRYAIKPNHTGD